MGTLDLGEHTGDSNLPRVRKIGSRLPTTGFLSCRQRTSKSRAVLY